MGNSAAVSQDLIRQYFTNLKSQFQDALAHRDFSLSKSEPVIAELEALLTSGSTETWDDAYRAEQLLISILPGTRLDALTAQHMTQAAKMLAPAVVRSFEDQIKNNPNQLRPILASLTAELQWAYSTRTLKRKYQDEATALGMKLFMTAFGLFIVSVTGAMFLVDNTPRLLGYVLLHAIVSGALGASYSTLTSIRSYPENIPVERIQSLCSLGFLLSRILIGLCAALVLVFLFHSGLVQSSLLPNLDSESLKSIQLSETQFINFFLLNKNFSLLTVYCFLAGFSEKMVPSMLTRVESRLDAPGKA